MPSYGILCLENVFTLSFFFALLLLTGRYIFLYIGITSLSPSKLNIAQNNVVWCSGSNIRDF